MLRRFFCLSILLTLLTVALDATPLPAPAGAGIVEREIEKEYEGKPLDFHKEIPAIQIDIPEERLELPSGKRVMIHQVEIRGNTVVSSEEICRWVNGCVDLDLSIQDIYKLCSLIDHHYAEKGYFLARSYPPPQAIENGVLVIEVLEGKLGQVKIIGNKHYTKSFILRYFASLQHKPLHYDEFLRSLLLLNELSDLTVAAVFEKGKEFGTADVIVRVHDARPVHLYLNGNNYGKDLTTNFRAGGRLDSGNVLAYGDTLSVAEVLGFPVEALYFTDVTYNVPLNAKGTFFGFGYLFSKFKIEELQALRLKGRSDIASVNASHAILRKRSLSIDLFASFEYKQIQNFALSTRASFDKLRVLTFGTLIDHYNLTWGRDYLRLRVGAGIPDFLGGLSVVDSESSRPGAGGRFFLFNLDYDRLQQLPKDCFCSFHYSGQWSPTKLTLPEQIYIGGADTVRGFPLAIALGDSGYYSNFELHVPLPLLANKKFFMMKKKWKEVLQIVGFLDQGWVFLKSGHDTYLWGSGVGLRFNGPYHFALSLDFGFPLNHRDLSKDTMTYLKITWQPF